MFIILDLNVNIQQPKIQHNYHNTKKNMIAVISYKATHHTRSEGQQGKSKEAGYLAAVHAKLWG